MPSELDIEAAKVLTILSIADLVTVQAQSIEWVVTKTLPPQHFRHAGEHATRPNREQLHRSRRTGR